MLAKPLVGGASVDLQPLGFDRGSSFGRFADVIVEAAAAAAATCAPVKVLMFLFLPWKPVMENKANVRLPFMSHRQIYEDAAGGNAVISATTAPAGLYWPAGGIRQGGRKTRRQTG